SGRFVDVGDLRGVESNSAGRHEPDVEWVPDREDERVLSWGQLPGGFVDRELREVGAVVGEHDRSARGFEGFGGHVRAASSVNARRRWRLRTAASSGGEYHAGPSPFMKRSRSGVWGRARPSA